MWCGDAWCHDLSMRPAPGAMCLGVDVCSMPDWRCLAGEDKRTTLMMKNIPNKYTQKMLLAAIDEDFARTYDFFYLPIDFKNKCNVGYAFINLLRPETIAPLAQRFNNKKWPRFNSEKVCHISYARIQVKLPPLSPYLHRSCMCQTTDKCISYLILCCCISYLTGMQRQATAPCCMTGHAA